MSKNYWRECKDIIERQAMKFVPNVMKVQINVAVINKIIIKKLITIVYHYETSKNASRKMKWI